MNAVVTEYKITAYGNGAGNFAVRSNGEVLGVFNLRMHAQLFVNALELADMGAPIADGIGWYEDDESDD